MIYIPKAASSYVKLKWTVKTKWSHNLNNHTVLGGVSAVLIKRNVDHNITLVSVRY